MTVTSSPAELRAAAVRAEAQGMYALASHYRSQAIDNNIALRRSSGDATLAASDTSQRTTDVAKSHVIVTHGADGRQISAGPVT